MRYSKRPSSSLESRLHSDDDHPGDDSDDNEEKSSQTVNNSNIRDRGAASSFLEKQASSKINADPQFQVQLIGRLYLLASIKLTLDWVQSDHFRTLRQLVDLSSSNQGDGFAQAHLVIQYTLQRWCTQLAVLLNRLYPVYKDVIDALPLENVSAEVHAHGHNGGLQPRHIPVDLHLPKFSSTGLNALIANLKVYDKCDCPSHEAPNDDPIHEANPVEPVQCLLPLPEDWLLRGLPSLDGIHQWLNFDQAVLQLPFSQLDEAILRSTRMIHFAKHLSIHAIDLSVKFAFHGDDARATPFEVYHPPTSSKRMGFLPHPQRSGRFAHRRWYNQYHHTRYRGPHPSTTRGGRSSMTQTNRRNDPSWAKSGPSMGTRGSFTMGHHGPTQNRSHVGIDKRPSNLARAGSPNELDAVAQQSSNSSLPMGSCCVVEESNRSTEQKGKSRRGLTCSYEVVDVDHPSEKDDEQEFESSKPETVTRKTQIMRDMARLRLLNEVDELARQCQNPSAKETTNSGSSPTDPTQSLSEVDRPRQTTPGIFSPYLVLDAYCWVNHLAHVKQFVASRSFVLIVPVTVVAHLDYLKKTTATARVAIRFLEQESHAGNRFIRLQKPEEQPMTELARTARILGGSCLNQEASSAETDREARKDSPRLATLRVVKRWLSILDCATYFSRTLGSTQEPPFSQKATSNDHDLPTVTLRNDPICCQDLIFVKSDPNDKTTTSVSILVGTRETNSEDTIVPGDFIDLVRNSGIRLETIGDFWKRWRKARA